MRLEKYSDDWFRQRLQAAELSAASKKAYADRLHVIQGCCGGRALQEILRDPAGTIRTLRDPPADADGRRMYGPYQPTTIAGFLTVVKALLKHAGAVSQRALPQSARYAWQALFEESQRALDQRYQTLAPSARQLQGFVPWPEVLKRRGELAADDARHLEHLALCLHTMLGPVRADFGRLPLVVAGEPGAREADYLEVAPGAEGYAEGRLVCPPRGGRPGTSLPLPDELLRALRRSVDLLPRAFVLVSPADRQPWALSQTFVNWVNRALQRTFNNRAVTVTLLRHSFAQAHGGQAGGSRYQRRWDVPTAVPEEAAEDLAGDAGEA